MREMIIISAEELDEIKAETERLRRELHDRFTQDEMDAIREQLEQRVRAVEAAREELEWRLRVELARVREAQASPQTLSQGVSALLRRLESLVGAGDGSPNNIRRVA
jgi:hypothetical protein